MIINENTKIIGRFHTKASGRGLNIYNPFFEEVGINALYVLFHNEDPKKLIDGYRSLGLFGAITAGFESNTELPNLLDEVDERAKFIGKIGYISNEDDKIVGHAQGGLGMYNTLTQTIDIKDKKIVIVGAGNITKGLLYEINNSSINCQVDIYNRSKDKTVLLQNKFDFIKNVNDLELVKKVEGDVLLNLTDIGGSEPDDLYTEEIVSNFNSIIDVTFEKENTNLISLAKKMNKKYATGWDMFTNQGLVILEDLFKQKFGFELFKKHVTAGLSAVVA